MSIYLIHVHLKAILKNIVLARLTTASWTVLSHLACLGEEMSNIRSHMHTVKTSVLF